MYQAVVDGIEAAVGYFFSLLNGLEDATTYLISAIGNSWPPEVPFSDVILFPV